MQNKIASLDIETTNLKANFGYILCACIKPLGKPVKKFSITDYPALFKKDATNDGQLIHDLYKEILKYDTIFTWYGKKFDWPFIQTRLWRHGTRVLPSIAHIDGWETARYKLCLHSNRLNVVANFFPNVKNGKVLDDKVQSIRVQKTALLGDQWVRAAAGHKQSIRYVMKHCVNDVIVSERIYCRLKPLLNNHPNLALGLVSSACPRCKERVTKYGTRTKQTTVWQRFACTNPDCGYWSEAPLKKNGSYGRIR